jgi:hypothetical protein
MTHQIFFESLDDCPDGPVLQSRSYLGIVVLGSASDLRGGHRRDGGGHGAVIVVLRRGSKSINNAVMWSDFLIEC